MRRWRARSGLHGERVEKPEDLRPALQTSAAECAGAGRRRDLADGDVVGRPEGPRLRARLSGAHRLGRSRAETAADVVVTGVRLWHRSHITAYIALAHCAGRPIRRWLMNAHASGRKFPHLLTRSAFNLSKFVCALGLSLAAMAVAPPAHAQAPATVGIEPSAERHSGAARSNAFRVAERRRLQHAGPRQTGAAGRSLFEITTSPRRCARRRVRRSTAGSRRR